MECDSGPSRGYAPGQFRRGGRRGGHRAHPPRPCRDTLRHGRATRRRPPRTSTDPRIAHYPCGRRHRGGHRRTRTVSVGAQLVAADAVSCGRDRPTAPGAKWLEAAGNHVFADLPAQFKPNAQVRPAGATALTVGWSITVFMSARSVPTAPVGLARRAGHVPTTTDIVRRYRCSGLVRSSRWPGSVHRSRRQGGW